MTCIDTSIVSNAYEVLFPWTKLKEVIFCGNHTTLSHDNFTAKGFVSLFVCFKIFYLFRLKFAMETNSIQLPLHFNII